MEQFPVSVQDQLSLHIVLRGALELLLEWGPPGQVRFFFFSSLCGGGDTVERQSLPAQCRRPVCVAGMCGIWSRQQFCGVVGIGRMAQTSLFPMGRRWAAKSALFFFLLSSSSVSRSARFHFRRF